MTRSIDTHKVPGDAPQNQLKIDVLDEPGAGGACHLYQISGLNSGSNPSDPFQARYGAPANHATVLFQNGPIGEAGLNGVTNEALLAIIIDRLRAFAEGPFPSRENALARTKCEEALRWLKSRTAARLRRGVERKLKA